MNIYEATERTDSVISRLMAVWKDSVKATHFFLTEENRRLIAGYVPGALRKIPHLVIAENKDSEPVGFMGIDGSKLEMLFISPHDTGKGLGKRLLEYGITEYAVAEVCVNEQNPAAAGFYEHMGFQTFERTECDEQGNPFPLLYMKLKI